MRQTLLFLTLIAFAILGASAPRAEDEAEKKKPAAATPKDPADPKAAEKKDEPKKEEEDDTPPPADLIAAAKGGSFDYVKKMIAADPECIKLRSGVKDTALHWAASCGHKDIVKYLIEKGADVNAVNISGKTPLHLAVRISNKDIIKILLDAKADVNAKADDPDDDASGETPLHVAVTRCKLDVIELLLDNKADPKATTKGGVSIVDIAKKRDRTDLMKLLAKHGVIDEE